MLFLCGVQLVLRSGVLTVLDLDKVDLLMAGGAAERCFWSPSVAPCHS